ncbi:MAG: hypothetical protein ACOCZ8_00960 [Bacteroidota bacterium]
MRMRLLSSVFYLAIQLMVSPAVAQSTEMLDAQYGFMGVQFGDSLEVIEQTYDTLVPQRNFEKKHRYRLLEPLMQFEGVKLEFADLLLFENRLHSVYLRTNDKASSAALLQAFETLYGQGKQQSFANNFIWKGERVVLLFDENLLTGKADVRVISISMENRFGKKWRQVDRQW